MRNFILLIALSAPAADLLAASSVDDKSTKDEKAAPEMRATTQGEVVLSEATGRPIVVDDAIEILTEDFLDPAASQFRRLQWLSRDTNTGSEVIVCGEFNAKNAYGAYTGFKRFIVRDGSVQMREDTAELPEIADAWWTMLCKANETNTEMWSEAVR